MTPQYIAGFFDGEGYIGIYRNKGCIDKRYKSGRRTPGWIRSVGINNTYLPILDYLHNEFCGGLRVLREAEGTHKKIYSWSLGASGDIKVFLDFLLPFLQEKRPQAHIMLSNIEGTLDFEHASVKLKELKHV